MRSAGFGTDGWRGVIADGFTVQNLRSVAQAVVSHILKTGASPLMAIGHDTRFMSERFAVAAAEVAAGNGVKAIVSGIPVTTPMLSFLVKDSGLSGGLMVTASHNPYIYNGLKFKAAYGGSATRRMVSEVEGLIGAGPVLVRPFEAAKAIGLIDDRDFFGPYRKALGGLVDTGLINRSSFKAGFDCMWGASQYYVDRLFADYSVDVRVMRANRDPFFGGIAPEPTEESMSGLSAMVRAEGLDIGFAFDGDADRLGVVDDKGRHVTPHQILALLAIHLNKNRGLEGAVVKTVSTSSVVDRVASDLRLPVRETPVGFKHICEVMLSEDVMIGGEENGGLGVKGHIPERDGFLAALLVLDMLAFEGKPMSELVAGLNKKYGEQRYKRIDVTFDGGRPAIIMKEVGERGKSVFGSFGVRDVRTKDGVKFVMKDGSWILFRASGTEPMIRVYAEAEGPDGVERLIDRAREAFLG